MPDDLQVCFPEASEADGQAYLRDLIPSAQGVTVAGAQQTSKAYAIGVRFDDESSRRELIDRTKKSPYADRVVILLDASAEACP